MTARLAHILRHPIKAVGVEEIARASLHAGRALASDRRWAVAHRSAKFEGQPGAWQSKLNFLRGVAGPELMAITARSDGAKVSLHHPRAGTIALDMASEADHLRLIAWLTPLWPEGRPAPSHVVEVPGQALTDWPDPFLSLLSLASLDALSHHAGWPLHPNRWRGNLWIAGWEPLAERALIGRRLRIGTAMLEIVQPVTRCRATCVNPETGADDCDTLAALDTLWGHKDFGVYARVLTGGEIAQGDSVEII
ncbi:MAG: MOSC domain-containing protein [Phaeovulum sp.]|uniref:MOSC domain-containing protein n=1 Tax=Phaeovulum sp. TaxID=2934796 RepID=UPI00272F3786|nr:MOSC domain-containing protein [Phaeovulum sp.]MDP2063105.1 MOSC domain-containing protein [Phaeovulum sp.]